LSVTQPYRRGQARAPRAAGKRRDARRRRDLRASSRTAGDDRHDPVELLVEEARQPRHETRLDTRNRRHVLERRTDERSANRCGTSRVARW